jgi:chemotaxis protein methyltransferase CheR
MPESLSPAPHQASGIIPGVSPAIYNRADFDRIAAFMRRETCVVLDERKRMLAYSRLAPLVRSSGLTSFAAYLDALEQDPGQQALAISALTTNHTYFNREPHHFEHFANVLRPDLLRRAASGEPIRLWSAGCSSGEEVWSLIMFLLGDDPASARKIAAANIIALASDIALDALATARAAIYSAEAVAAMPEALCRLWCCAVPEAGAGRIMIAPELRAMVRFRELNLFGSWPMRQPFDMIFCRNVMIYFDAPAKERLVLALAQQLRPGGFLYIGHSERVAGPAASLLECVGPTIYQRRLG